MHGALAHTGLAPRWGQRSAAVTVGRTGLLADLSGALYWPEERLLAVADLHLEKGSAFAARGLLVPPYDTAATLQRLAEAVAYYAPRTVIALGDSFHDQRGPARLSDADRATLRRLQRGRDWVWIAGNHDPARAERIGGVFAAAFAAGALVFRHHPSSPGAVGEIAGHLHPTARVGRSGRTLTRRCFAGDGERLVMPAFGAYAGGLNIRDRAFLDVFGALAFTAHLIGGWRLYTLAARQCLA